MEETSIPDELTYHEPAPRHAGEPRDALFMTARIVSLIFTPFMVHLWRSACFFSLLI